MLTAIDPDCRAGKHRACLGEAWDDVNDKPARCDCPCHESSEQEGDDQ
jgi:hypothetical protein